MLPSVCSASALPASLLEQHLLLLLLLLLLTILLLVLVLLMLLTPPLHVHHATGKKPVALMIAPTRELALQIAAVLEEAGSQCGIRWGRYACCDCILGLRYARCDRIVGLRYGSCIFLALSRLSCSNTFFSRLTATDLRCLLLHR